MALEYTFHSLISGASEEHNNRKNKYKYNNPKLGGPQDRSDLETREPRPSHISGPH